MTSESSNDALARLRQEYKLAELDESHLDSDPLRQFQRWFDEARAAQIAETNAMSVASVGADGRPSVRILLLKGLEQGGFTFYTNYESRKGHEFAANDAAALLFFWAPLERQVRIEGRIEKVPPEESDAYFRVRPVGARFGAWASKQSEVIASRAVIEQRLAETQTRFGDEPPRPPHWGGYRVMPDVLEFWQGRENRLHDRLRYRRSGDGWQIERLSP
ncbi:MAG: pyridoxamine 5'-phosphate oxidase [Burkholderiaceae bacterium]